MPKMLTENVDSYLMVKQAMATLTATPMDPTIAAHQSLLTDFVYSAQKEWLIIMFTLCCILLRAPSAL